MRHLALAAVVLLLPAAATGQQRPEWDDPAVLQVGALRPHATMMVYPDAALARTRDAARSPFYRSLAGRWRYGWRGRTALRWTLAGFAMLFLAYVGSRFVLEVLLGRTWWKR